MMIRSVQLSWFEDDFSGSNSFLFKERDSAILCAQQLLSDEHNERELSDEHFRNKSETYIEYFDCDTYHY